MCSSDLTCIPGICGTGCESDCVECEDGTHECDPNADCFNTYGSYICACKDEFYGDGVDCAPCSVCQEECEGEECKTGPGYTEDKKEPPCEASDRTCRDINECSLLDERTHNCDDHADCDNGVGSFKCTCQVNFEWWGEGTDGTCEKCTICDKGDYMWDDCTSTTDRICRVLLPDGNYAMETQAGSVHQCLVHWKEAGKIYPERYSWGGRTTTQTQTSIPAAVEPFSETNPEGENGPGPDYCKNPICGVCDWNDEDPKDNLVKGMEAVWTFKRLRDDLYLILNGADGQGFRCFGFQTPDAPYPTFVSWKSTQMDAATGVCNSTTTECTTDQDCMPVTLTFTGAAIDIAAGTAVEQRKTTPGAGNADSKTSVSRGVVVADVTAGNAVLVRIVEGTFGTTAASGTVTVGTATIDVSAVAATYNDVNSKCTKEAIIVGEWRTDEKGPKYEDLERCERNRVGLPINCELNYFCGFTNNANGDARTKMMSNGGTVWNVKQLGCTLDANRRWLCERDPLYENKFMIRSLAGQDANLDNSITKLDYECLYFPQEGGGMYSHPRRAPVAASADGIWLGMGGSSDVDGNGDVECGIYAEEDESQEDALINNKQAVFALISLPSY